MAAPKKNYKRYTCKQVDQILKHLKGSRGTWEEHWQEVTDYILPRKNTVLNYKSPGQKRTWQLLDNIGVYCNELLAGALQGLLTNPDLHGLNLLQAISCWISKMMWPDGYKMQFAELLLF